MNKPARIAARYAAVAAIAAGSFFAGLAIPATRPAYLPDPVLSPGAVYDVTRDQTCVPGYATKARNVTEAMKRLAYARYKIVPDGTRYEVDHLIALTIGGANTVENLFIQPRNLVVNGRRMGAAEKDRAEVATSRAVCAGKIPLAEAQRLMAKDWTKLFLRFVAPEFPKATPDPTPTGASRP